MDGPQPNDLKDLTFQQISALLDSPDVQIRRDAVISLSRLKNKDFIPIFIKALSDQEDIAMFAMLGLTMLGDEAFQQVASALSSPLPQVRAYCLEILGETRDHSVLDRILNLARNDPSNWVRHVALDTVQKFDDPRVSALFRELCGSTDMRERITAMVALHRLNPDGSGIRNLLEMLSEENEEYRHMISWAVIETAGTADIGLIRSMIENNPGEKYKAVLNEIIRSIQSR